MTIVNKESLLEITMLTFGLNQTRKGTQYLPTLNITRKINNKAQKTN